jgi:hypothetical protein
LPKITTKPDQKNYCSKQIERKGKRGGCCVIFCVKDIANSIFLLSIGDKGVTGVISANELDEFLV